MPYDSLADFLEDLHRREQLVRVSAETDTELEAAAITRRVAEQRGPALLLEHVRGRPWPVVTNLLGSQARVALALGVESLQEAAARVQGWLAASEPRTWLERIKRSNPSDAAPTRLAKQAVSQQVVKLGRDVDLGQLPALRSWPLERHATITSAHVFWHEPESQRLMLEALPVEIHGNNRAAILWQPHSAFAGAIAAATTREQPLPMAVVLGGDPIFGLLTRRWPPQWCRLQIAAMLRARPIDLVRCRTQPVEAPAEAEIILEGFIERTGASADGSPIVGPSGYYLPPAGAAEMLVTAMTHRINPVFPAEVSGPGLHEAVAIDLAVLELLRPIIAQAVPELVDFHAPTAAGWNPALFVSIRKQRPGQARQAAAALWGLHVTATMRLIVVVDESVDVRNSDAVIGAIGNSAAAGDIWSHSGPAAANDHASEALGLGTHLAIDATAKLPGEHPRPWPRPLIEDEATGQLLRSRWREYGLPDSFAQDGSIAGAVAES